MTMARGDKISEVIKHAIMELKVSEPNCKT